MAQEKGEGIHGPWWKKAGAVLRKYCPSETLNHLHWGSSVKGSNRTSIKTNIK